MFRKEDDGRDVPIRPTLLIADDARLYADCLSSMLNRAFETVAIVTTGKELIEAAIKLQPDLIVTEILMPANHGLDAIRSLAATGLNSKIIVLTRHLDPELAAKAFGSGASAFVLQTGGADELQQALKVVLGGGYYLSSQCPSDLMTVLAQAARHTSAR